MKGQVKLKSFTENPHSIFEYAPIHLGDEPLAPMRKMGVSGDNFIIAIEGITTRDEADLLKGAELWVERDALPKSAEGEYYISDLVGVSVHDAKRPEKKIGQILEFFDFGAGPVFEIKFNNGTTEMLPYTPEIVREVKLKEGIVLVEMPNFTEAK